MKTKIEIKNEASVCTIDIEGVIGVAEESQFSAQSQSVATYEKFRREVEKIRDIEADEVVVNIRSTGGDVNDALLI
jgi:ClpP class serine protease